MMTNQDPQSPKTAGTEFEASFELLPFDFDAGVKFPDIGETGKYKLGNLEHRKEFKALNLTFGKGCPNEAAPKVAVCFAGLSRSFASPDQAAYINSMLLKPIRDAGGRGLVGAPPDVFVATRLGHAGTRSKTPEKREWADKNYKIGTDYTNQKMINNLANSQHENANKREFVEESIKEIGAVDFTIDNYTPVKVASCFTGKLKAMSWFRDVFGCLTMIRKAEEKTNDKYDVVVTSRADTWEIDGNKERTLRVIQCNKSIFLRDAISYETRASFDVHGNYLNDQFQNPNCHQPRRRNQEGFTVDIAETVKGIYEGG